MMDGVRHVSATVGQAGRERALEPGGVPRAAARAGEA